MPAFVPLVADAPHRHGTRWQTLLSQEQQTLLAIDINSQCKNKANSWILSVTLQKGAVQETGEIQDHCDTELTSHVPNSLPHNWSHSLR